MHLDAITAELKVGDEVEAGQVLGTLGRSGIHSGEPHLHFALEIQDGGQMRYLDPSPFLARAEVVPVPDDELRLSPDDRSQW
jgi:murein DD-endopeptidase MepM/ murein hydrolase activator NlpD